MKLRHLGCFIALALGLGVMLNARAATLYVSLDSTNPIAPYADWSTAATNIQSAIIAANPSDLVLVSNGLYSAYGGYRIDDPSNGDYLIFCQVIVSNGVTVSSLNGPASTIIQGGPFFSCACLVGNAELNGFTLSNGTAYPPNSSPTFGGGAYCFSTNALLVNCIICSNTATAGAGVFSGTLINCLVSNNVAGGTVTSSGQRASGGGACGSVMYNCILAANAAANGGGAYNCLLTDCSLIGNNAFGNTTGGAGGGAFGGVLNDCTLWGNTATNTSYSYGGGATVSNVLNDCVIADNETYLAAPRAAIGCYMTNCTICRNTNLFDDGNTVVAGCTLRNCILYYNGNTTYFGNDLKFCCTELPSTYPPAGSNDISAAPLFVNTNNDFHLMSNSPCINSGNNAFVTVTNDIDGNPRIAGGTVDIGAYEYQTPASIISYAFLQQYGLPTDGSVDYSDLDGTGFDVYQDWVAGLDPTNPASVLVMSSVVLTNASTGVTVTWQSVNTRTYYLQRGVDLAAEPAFSSIQSNLVGQAGTTSYTDTTATNGGPYFYRVGLQ